MTDTTKSLGLSKEISQGLEGLTTGSEDRLLFPGLFYSLVIEHHRSVIVLCERQLYSSAASLVRCIFEAYVKGLWFSEFASEEDFAKLRNDTFNKNFYKLVDAIEKKHNNGLKLAKERYWPNLNSFTHSGTAQLSRRVKGDEIISNFDDELISQILMFSNTYAILAFGKIVEMSDDDSAYKVFSAIVAKYSEFHPSANCVQSGL
ncbi:DUF6988 family protein [Vibrio sp. M260121]|uniref:DUF6988 family protein n=1 Tax=Vibrio sp. M260121 TaxID=3020897 RepID=UPI002F3FB618